MDINDSNQNGPCSSEQIEVPSSEQIIDGNDDNTILENEKSFSLEQIEIQVNDDSIEMSEKEYECLNT